MGSTLSLLFTGILLAGIVTWAVLGRRRRDTAWRQLAADIGGQFVSGGLFGRSKVQAQVQQSVLTLDSYSVPAGDTSTAYTRLRASLPGLSTFEFAIAREGLIARLDKALGAQDIEIGVPDFDHDFIIRSNDPARVRLLLSEAKVRQLIQDQSRLHLGLRAGTLVFEAQGLLIDVDRLKSLFQLFETLLSRLH